MSPPVHTNQLPSSEGTATVNPHRPNNILRIFCSNSCCLSWLSPELVYVASVNCNSHLGITTRDRSWAPDHFLHCNSTSAKSISQRSRLMELHNPASYFPQQKIKMRYRYCTSSQKWGISYSKSSNILLVFHFLVLTFTHYLSCLQVFASIKNVTWRSRNRWTLTELIQPTKQFSWEMHLAEMNMMGKRKSTKSCFSKPDQGAENCYL